MKREIVIFAGTFLAWLIPHAAVALIQFEEVTEQAGIKNLSQSVGLSWGDFNGDGRPDLWTQNHVRKPVLYVGNPHGTFEDAIPYMNGVDFKGDLHGGAWADFDNDGDQDLLVLAGGEYGVGSGPSRLYVNGPGGFSEKAALYFLDDSLGRGRTPLWLDWDGDGFLDVYYSNRTRPDGLAPSMLYLRKNGLFYPETAYSSNKVDMEWAQLVVTADGSRLFLASGAPSYPGLAVLRSSDGSVISNSPYLMDMSSVTNVKDAAIDDFNGDGLLDIFLVRSIEVSEAHQASDRELRLSIYANSKPRSVTFKCPGEITHTLLSKSALDVSDIYLGTYGVHPSDYVFQLSSASLEIQGEYSEKENTIKGIFIGYDHISETWTIEMKEPTTTRLDYQIVSKNIISNLSRHGFAMNNGGFQPNLFLQSSDGFINMTASAGLNRAYPANSVVSGDFDNDMDKDIYIVCRSAVVNLPNVLLENNGNGQFTESGQATGAEGALEGIGDSAAVADFDLDGFLDLAVTNGGRTLPWSNGPLQLFRNKGNTNHWIEIDLKGVLSNSDGIGAFLSLRSGNVTQVAQQDNGMHKFSQNYQRTHFGLGENETIDQLTISWPSGIIQKLRDITADQLLILREPFDETLQSDMDVDGLDLACLATHFNALDCPGSCPGDYFRDGRIDENDLSIFLQVFGNGPPMERAASTAFLP